MAARPTVSPHTTNAISAVQGGARQKKLATDEAFPFRINTNSTVIAPTERTKLSYKRAKTNSLDQTTCIDSKRGAPINMAGPATA